MELAWPWLPPLLFLGGLVVSTALLLASLLIARARRAGRMTLVANTLIVQDGRRFRSATRTYRALLALAVAVALTALGAAAVTAARVTVTASYTPETRNRDIVLCLDVSGSMRNFDSRLLSSFEALASEFAGERIGLVLFDSSPLQVFPLTEDYPHALAQLRNVAAGLDGEQDGYAYRDGTRGGDGSSRVGDGLAGCVLQFDRAGNERSRTIVVATDNQSVGRSILTLAEASAVAVADGIQVYGLNPDRRQGRAEGVSFRAEVEATGGRYFAATSEAESAAAIQSIVEGVTSNPATVTVGSPVRTTTDAPDLFIWVLSASTLLLFLLVWRLRL